MNPGYAGAFSFPIMEPAPYVTVTFMRFPRGERLWAMRQMAEKRAPMREVEGLLFHKLLGTGGGRGYSGRPDLGTYAVLGAWCGEQEGKEFLSGSSVMTDYCRHTEEVFTLHLSPLSSRGSWSGRQPFKAVEDPAPEAPLAVITRATIRPRYVLGFWSQVGRVSRSLEQHREGLLFTKGIGELPWVEQATFSVWRSLPHMQAFAHAQGTPHAEAIARTRKADGFREELYARFRVTGTEGTWNGTDPVRDALQAAG